MQKSPASWTARVWRRGLTSALVSTAAALSALGPTVANAQDYPSRPLRIVPFGSAGGPIDRLARLYGEKLTQRFGQPVIVDARPGASGIIAADAPYSNLKEYAAFVKAKAGSSYGTWGIGSTAHLFGELFKRQTLLDTGFEPLGNSPQEFSTRFRADLPRVADLIKAAGITPE